MVTEPKIRIRVKTEACVGHARCAAVAPQVYELDDNGYNVTREKLVSAALRDMAVKGARACPEKIIVVEEVEGDS